MSDLDDVFFLQALMVENGYSHARPIGRGRYACISPFVFTTAIIVGRMGDHCTLEDRWCYHSEGAAVAALEAWDGNGEPTGWHRHPGSGRRLAETDNCFDDDDKPVEIGSMYVRR